MERPIQRAGRMFSRTGLRAFAHRMRPGEMLRYVEVHLVSLGSIAIRGMSVLAGFIITFYLGHRLGPLANGQYALIAQTAMFLSVIAVGGMDLAVVRHFSATMSLNRPLSPRSLLRAAGFSFGAGALIVLTLVIGGPPLLKFLFDRDLPRNALLILCVLLMARTGTRLTAAVLRSQEQHLRGQSVEVLIIPGCVAIMLMLGILEHDLHTVLWATAIVGVGTAIFGLLSASRFVRRDRNAIDVTFGTLFQTSLPLWATAIALNINDWYSLATAATTLSVYDAGLYRIAFQIGGALSFAATGMYNVFTARISAAVAVGDRHRVARLARSCTRLSIACVLPAVIALLVIADPLLRAIHPEFVRAVPLLRVILIGQAFWVLTGPAGLVLAMTGHERINFMISAGMTVILLLTAPFAASAGGLLGLATLTAAVPLASNLANVIAVYRLEGINVMTGSMRSDGEDAPAA